MSDDIRRKQERYAQAVAELKKREARKAQASEGGLYEFVKYFWHVLEVGRPLVEGWVMEAICLHLEAVTFGDIKKILINVSPGSSKSILVNTFWPAWEWGPMGLPQTRYLSFAYGAHLTERDNGRFRDLIRSPEYRELWGDIFSLTKDGEVKVANDKTGWKFASSVTGVGTGERGDRILCLPGDILINTSIGELPIKEIVDKKLEVMIAGYDHDLNRQTWQRILKYETNPGRELVQIDFDGRHLRCTADHRVFVRDRGYIAAEDVNPGDYLEPYREVQLPDLWCGGALQAKPSQVPEVLFKGLPVSGATQESHKREPEAVCQVRDSILSAASTYGEDQPRESLLQPEVLRRGQSRRSQSGLWRWSHNQTMRVVWSHIHKAKRRGISFVEQNVFAQMRGSSSSGEQAIGQMLRVRRSIQSAPSSSCLLLKSLCQQTAFATDARVWKWSLRAWQIFNAVSAWLEQGIQTADQIARQVYLSLLRSATAGQLSSPCPSYRLQQAQFGPQELNYSLPLLPRKDARRSKAKSILDGSVVTAVRKCGYEPVTYNLNVSPNHNYYANEILVHNCDDPHNVVEAESEPVRTRTVQWFRESMSNRLNDQAEGAIVVIMQRLAEHDVSGIILEHYPDYEHLCIPTEYDPSRHCTTSIGWTDPRSVEGELAWPERFPAHVLAEFKKMPYVWAGQYQQAPEPRGGGIIKRHYWQYYTPEVQARFGVKPLHPSEIRKGKDALRFPPFDYVVAALDSAYTDKEENDPNGFSVWGVFHEADQFDSKSQLVRTGRPNIMLIMAWRKWLEMHGDIIEKLPNESDLNYIERSKPHWGLTEWVAYECRRWQVDRLLIEGKASGLSVVQEMKRLYASDNFGVQIVNPKDDTPGQRGGADKTARLWSVQHLFADGLIWIPCGNAGTAESPNWQPKDFSQLVIDEAAIYPRGYKDVTDSMVYALKHLRKAEYALRKQEFDIHEVERRMFKRKLEPIYQV